METLAQAVEQVYASSVSVCFGRRVLLRGSQLQAYMESPVSYIAPRLHLMSE
jgi:hypothetical protein